MIYVVEFPHNGRARSWFAFSREDFVRKVYASDEREEWEIFDVLSMRELLEMMERAPETPGVCNEFPSICSLADEHGWDTPLYRADYLLGDGMFQPQQIREEEACLAALKQRYKDCLVYWSDTEATAAMESDPHFASREGYWGREALREQLVALEILEGPYG